MNRAEVLEFLELPDSATDNDIRVRMNDKLSYFQRLSENAPNDFLRKLHTSNTEKIKTLQLQMMGGEVGNTQPQHVGDAAYNRNINAGHHATTRSGNRTEVAWLVRHTENQSAKTFPIFYGKNYIGRNTHASGSSIVINEDPYISRIHALLEVINVNPLQVVVTDDAQSNGGKPSKNGTYINGDDKRLAQRITIGPNDTIQVGMTKLIVRLNNTSLHKIVQEVEESDYMKTVVIDIF